MYSLLPLSENLAQNSLHLFQGGTIFNVKSSSTLSLILYRGLYRILYKTNRINKVNITRRPIHESCFLSIKFSGNIDAQSQFMRYTLPNSQSSLGTLLGQHSFDQAKTGMTMWHSRQTGNRTLRIKSNRFMTTKVTSQSKMSWTLWPQ